MYELPQLNGSVAWYLKNGETGNLDFKFNRMYKDLEVASKGMRANKNKVRELERDLEKVSERLKQLEKTLA
jgi:predicted  nucleic acid-binding Zn-ribbon protein